ncbi:MAG: hypothetical protein L0312_28325, partial [Acidobacteria bacterium]|nr:hypothetical protein [Acidobacteriota bacterium]
MRPKFLANRRLAGQAGFKTVTPNNFEHSVLRSIVLLLFGVLVSPPSDSQAQSVPTTLTPIADTYIKQGTPNQNQGTEAMLQVRALGNNRALVRFDQSAIASAIGTGTLGSAKLRLYIVSNANNWGSGGRVVNVHRMN